MERSALDSSTIHAVGYDPDAQILEVEFKTGEIYEYYEVPLEIHQDLLAASSHGQFFNAFIKNIYDYRKMN
jgi:hypothetical protein